MTSQCTACLIGDVGTQALADALKTNTTLKTLDLHCVERDNIQNFTTEHGT